MFEEALILTGPTGSGKSALGLALAERLGAEIVAMDSMTLYRGMDIGTAKPTAAERARVPHHLLDVLDPWESASVAWWLEQARACCRDIQARGKRVLFVGGTPLYLKALQCGLFEGPPAAPEVRQRLEAEAAQGGREALHRRLATVDPSSAARLHPNDLRRVVRALEIWELTGRPISDWQKQWPDTSSDPTCESAGIPLALWLDRPRPELYERINQRVVQMIEDGLVAEVRALRELSQPLSREASQALGYKELFDHLDGRATLDEAIVRIQTRTRNFAKRQITWFRHLPGCLPATEELTFRLWAS
ncbi:MAG: tRNA (adenosine(37)-N6)-dimethylallyltransferase MiaA [Planctomycetia bacterium]|nr:tRNA (adenosine(37)-N6)-dimethylallyltransferase MiaA [Planctomycetia bacterium]